MANTDFQKGVGWVVANVRYDVVQKTFEKEIKTKTKIKFIDFKGSGRVNKMFHL